MNSTRVLSKGMKVLDTGSPIMIPIGEEMLGRIVNFKGKKKFLSINKM